MKWLRLGLLAALVLTPFWWASAAEVKSRELARAVPADVYLFVYGKHNPKRDFQEAYLRDVWKTVEETQIISQAAKIVTSRLSSADREKAGAVLEEIKKAAAPIKLEALANAKELVYAQKMTVMSEQVRALVSQHLLVVRLTPEAVEQTQAGVKNLFALIEKYSQGKATVSSATEGDATIVKLAVPQPFPFQPAVIRCGDVLIVSSSEALARESLGLLVRGGTSKYDDPQLVEALRHLPAPDDALAFMDGKLLFTQMRGLVDFVRTAGHGDEKAARIAGVMELLFDEISILDYQVSVEYTEGNLNRSVEYGKLLPGAEAKTLTKMVAGGQPFADWQRWVPANASSYSLSTGVNLHLLYERVVAVIRERFPEAAPKLDKFEQFQSQIGVHLDRDILQAFSGECVSVSVSARTEPAANAGGSVWAMRCQKPDRIRELLHRAVDAIKKHPAVAAQQLQLSKCPSLDGFEEFSATAIASLGLKPVVGFHDGWMIVGSHVDAVKAVLATRDGKSPNIAGTKTFTQFHLSVEGPVQAISYTNTAENIRKAAAAINQIGMMAPMFLGMAGANAKPEQIKPVQEVLALLPSVAKIVAKFDYLQATMSVTQAGGQPGTFQTRSVTIIRPPAGK